MHDVSDHKKVRVTITLDDDVHANATETARCQRNTLSGMINQILAQMCGMIPRKSEVPDER